MSKVRDTEGVLAADSSLFQGCPSSVALSRVIAGSLAQAESALSSQRELVSAVPMCMYHKLDLPQRMMDAISRRSGK